MAKYDVLVVGGGHNGLIVAAYLAKVGMNVCVLERAGFIGGEVITREVTVPGFKHDRAGSVHATIQANPLILYDELGLKSKYGLKYIYPESNLANVYSDGTAIVSYADIDKTCQQISQFSEKDADAYRTFCETSKPMLNMLAEGIFNPPPPLGKFFAQLDQNPEGQQILSNLFRSGYDIVDRIFEHEKTKLAMLKLMTEPMIAPEDKGTAFYLYATILMNHAFPLGIPEGGSGMLSEALGRCIEANGGTIMLGSEVKRIQVESGKAMGVVLASGEEVAACRALVANLDPRLVFPHMVSEVDKAFVTKVGAIQDPAFSGMMQHIALNDAPKWKAGDEVSKAFNVEPLCWLEDYRRLFDDLRYGIPPSPEHLAPLACCPTVHDPTRAPAGKHILYLWHYVPYYLRDGGPQKWDEIKEQVADRILEGLRGYTTNMGPENIIARTIFSPLDYERMNPSLVNGSILGPGAFLHQFFSHRPIPELGQYRTPIGNLYMSGQSFHPGGSIIGGGRATVQVIMADLGIEFAKVIGR